MARFFHPHQTGSQFHHVPLNVPAFIEFAKAKAKAKDRGEFEIRARMLDNEALGLLAGSFRKHLAANQQIPADMRDAAAKHARDLNFRLKGATTRVRRHQTHGALDSSKLARLARPGISTREFERLSANAYKSRGEHAAMRWPRIAICADFNNNIRTSNPSYVPALGKLAYALAAACALADIEVAVYCSRGGDRAQKMASIVGAPFGKLVHVPAVVKDFHDPFTAETFGYMSHHSGFAAGIRVPLCEFPKYRGQGMGSSDGSGSLEFARLNGAEFVIGIGTFHEAGSPDCHLSPGLSLDAMVEAVASAFERHMQQAA